MDLKEFAQMLDGKERGNPQFTKEEIQIANDNGFVIVYGASDDLVELDGAIRDEGDCYGGGKISVKAVQDGGIIYDCYYIEDAFSFLAKWYEEKDENEKNIEYLYQAEKSYEELSKIYNFKKVNCAVNGKIRSIDEIQQDILDILLPVIN